MAEGGKEAIRADDEVVASSKVRELEKRVRELERVVGKRPWKTGFCVRR